MDGKRRLEGKAAVVTGANRGIGRAIAEAFAEQGAHLFLCDRETANFEEIAEAVAPHGGKTAHGQADVTDPEAVERAMAAAEDALGRIDILANCAGVFQSFKLLDYPLDEWNHVMNVNVNGTLLCCQAALRRMVPRGQGKVVNLASLAGKIGNKYRAAYYASKHAVIGLTRCAAMEMAEHGITVNAICPGMVDTDMYDQVLKSVGENMGINDMEKLRAANLKGVPIRRMIEAPEIAQLAVYLASPESDGMTGQSISLDGGLFMG